MKPIDPIPALGQPKWLLDGAIVPTLVLKISQNPVFDGPIQNTGHKV